MLVSSRLAAGGLYVQPLARVKITRIALVMVLGSKIIFFDPISYHYGVEGNGYASTVVVHSLIRSLTDLI